MKQDKTGKTPVGREAAARLDKLKSALERGDKPQEKVMRAFNTLLRQEEQSKAQPKGPGKKK